jgi:transcriptional regulator
MYLPSQFKTKNTSDAIDLIRANAFASLISVDDTELPFVSHIPLHLDERDDGLYLLGHVALPNPHWRYLKTRPRALVTFLGPHAYLSPQVYPDLARVPTWNYLAVHCTVTANLIESSDAKDALLKKLIGDHEPIYAEQWRNLGADYAKKMLSAIVGFELKVLDLQCKLKINQHRPEAFDAMKAMYVQGNDNERSLAVWMDRLGKSAQQTS